MILFKAHSFTCWNNSSYYYSFTFWELSAIRFKKIFSICKVNGLWLSQL